MALRPSVFGRVKEMSVRPVDAADTFCTTMSMLTSASAMARKMRRGLARLVRHTDDRDLRLGGVVSDTGDDRLLHRLVPLSKCGSLLTQVPCSPEKDERTWIGML